MDEQEFRRVEAWLYSIPRMEIAVESLNLELERLDTKRATPPRWASNLQVPSVMGGELDSRLQKWGEFIDEYPVRRQEIMRKIADHRLQLDSYEKVMDLLRAEDLMFAQLVRKKYIEKVRPDQTVWKEYLFVSERTYYRMRRYVVQTFFHCLPGVFNSGRIVAGKTA